MCSNIIKNIPILSEDLLNLINKEVYVRTKSVGKNFSYDLDDHTEEANKPEFINHRDTFFRDEGDQGKIEASEIRIVAEQIENIRLDNVPKFLRCYKDL